MKYSSIQCYGDSLTAGFGAAPSDGWIAGLAKDLPAVRFYNHGACGALFRDICAEASVIASYPADGEALLLSGGTNDILCGIRYDALLTAAELDIRSLSARVPLILATPLGTTQASVFHGWQAPWAFEKNSEEIGNYAEFLRALAADLSVPLIDFHKEFPAVDTYLSDGVHPNAAGYAIMRRIALKTLAPLCVSETDETN